MNRGVVAILGALVSAVAAAALAGQAQTPLIVAYMASDGELVPIARYDGTGWQNTWPEPIPDDAPLPVHTIGEIPRAWQDHDSMPFRPISRHCYRPSAPGRALGTRPFAARHVESVRGNRESPRR
jgi:hypothetical protein